MTDRDPQGEHESPNWLIAHRFIDEQVALNAYTQIRNLLLETDLDASVINFKMDALSHVAILGEIPLEIEQENQLHAIIDKGSEPADLIPEAVEQLQSRRRLFMGTGLDFLERRKNPEPI